MKNLAPKNAEQIVKAPNQNDKIMGGEKAEQFKFIVIQNGK